MNNPAPETNDLYRAFWRWHFYAGLLVMPFLMLLALTGGLYLFKDEFQNMIYRPLMTVEARAQIASPESWVHAAEKAAGGRAVLLSPPADASQSARLVVEAPTGDRRSVFVDPYDGRALGVVGGSVIGRFGGGTIMMTVMRLHDLMFTRATNILVEIIAGWAIVLVATGVFLWWPRGGNSVATGGVVTIRGEPRRRVFWRDLHAVTGIFVGIIILFLAVTGMPWSAIWGAEFQKVVTENNWGKPGAPQQADEHAAHQPGQATTEALPWAVQKMPMPMSMPMLMPMEHSHGALPIGAFLAVADEAGLPRPYVLSIPANRSQTWSAAYIPDRVEDSRTLYLDGASGEILRDVGYAQYGPVAKLTEWGVSVHTGVQYGLASKLVMLAGCIGIWILGISSLTMWWKRRPKGKLAAPRLPNDKRAYLGLAAVVAVPAVIYPLVGASLAAVLLLDLLLRKLAGRLA